MSRDQLIKTLRSIGPAPLAEIVYTLRVSARVLVPRLEGLISEGIAYQYTHADYERDCGRPVRGKVPTLYGAQ